MSPQCVRHCAWVKKYYDHFFFIWERREKERDQETEREEICHLLVHSLNAGRYEFKDIKLIILYMSSWSLWLEELQGRRIRVFTYYEIQRLWRDRGGTQRGKAISSTLHALGTSEWSSPTTFQLVNLAEQGMGVRRLNTQHECDVQVAGEDVRLLHRGAKLRSVRRGKTPSRSYK